MLPQTHQTQNLPNLEYAIMRNGIKHYAQCCAKIPRPIVVNYFSHYHLLYWSAGYTLQQIEAGLIVYDNTAYRVQYKGITRGRILELCQSGKSQYQLQISFREANPEWAIDPVVIISLGA